MADEAAFMRQLLQGLDDSFWTAAPSPDPSPRKQKKPAPCTPTKAHQTKQILSSTLFSADNHDITAFLEGSDSWDLDADPFSPVKPASSSKTVTAQVNFFALLSERVWLNQDLNVNYPTYVPEPCTRCVVESILEESPIEGRRKVLSFLGIMYLR